MPLRVGKYRITGLIGEGSMGVVYRAQDPDIQRSVAIKTIRAPLRQDTGRRAPRRCASSASRRRPPGRLNHPNIVAIYESGEYGESGQRALHRDGVRRRALRCPCWRARATRLALPDIIAVTLQLLEALQCAHAQRVWHCDIKPSNLLVAPDGRIKVTDFGIARVEASGITLRNALWGSPGYMAPERFAGGAMDQRVDLFSCGVLLYELLTGSAPFVGSASAVMYQVLQQQPPAPSTRGRFELRDARTRCRGGARPGQAPGRPLRQRRGHAPRAARSRGLGTRAAHTVARSHGLAVQRTWVPTWQATQTVWPVGRPAHAGSTP